MKNDDTTNILKIKTISPSSLSKDPVTNTASESQASDSSDSSPSDLRKRLEDLPSPNEFIFLADRVAALDRRICRKREAFLRLHGVANRIEENDEWEEREQRVGLESFLEASRPKDARARRRARVRLESSPRRDDKTMVISHAGDTTGPFKIIGNDDKLNTPAESSVDRSARDDCLQLPVIAIPRGQSRSFPLSEPSSTRFSHHSNGESRNIKCKAASRSYRNFTPRDRTSKSADLPSVLPFSLSSVQSKKFGGYRITPSSVILKNLSSGSESEFATETSRGLSSARKIGNTIATLELSSPESMAVSSVSEPTKKMPIMSARSDITGSVLPNLLPSSRSLDNDDLNHRIGQNASRSYIGQVNREGTKTCNEPGKVNTLKAIFNERASRDGFATKTFNELRQVELEYEDTRYQPRETSQATSTFFARNFMRESAELVTSTYNERVIHNEPATKAYDEFKRASGSEFEEEREEVDYQRVTSKIHHDDIQDQLGFNCPTDRSNFEANSLNNGDVAKWSRSTSPYTRDTVDTSHFIETIRNDVAEETLSSQTSEAYRSEDHSRSSCTAKIYLQRETLSRRKTQNGIDTLDRCDREIITKVPTLALNSQDISYSTSAGSRECSATRPLDPHALIKALSDVSLKQEKQGEDAARKDFYRGKDVSRTSDFPTKGETWRVPRISESPGKPLSRVPSRIPVRISGIAPAGNKLAGCYGPENSSEAANYAENIKFIKQNKDVPCESIVRHRLSTNSSCFPTCERDSSLRSKDTEVTIAEGAFVPDDETTEFDDRAPGSLTSTKSRSQSTPFGDCSYDKMYHLPEGKFQGGICPPVLFHKAAYFRGRDYAKIDDDVRSRSDRSTSRKSADTVDVTSATESPGLCKYKKTESSQIESLRNAEENATWRTEDECASINDEEEPEDTRAQGYMSRGETPEESYLEAERHDLAMERMYDTSRTQLLGIQKGGRKRRAGDDLEFDDEMSFEQNLESAQSENLMYQVHRTQELSNFAARISSSTMNLNCEAKRKKKKKSQERFPFTISETSGVLAAKRESACDYQSPDEDPGRPKTDDQLQERTVYQLKMHPSVTRLAASGMEDTVADILCCVAQEKKCATSSKSRMKALARIFSKLRKAPKQPDNKTAEPAEIIYENNACQADSKVSSCSGDSSTEGTRKTCSNDRWIDHHATRSKPMLVSSWQTLKKTESLQAIAQEHRCRRHDRDDLWVQDIKDSPFDKRTDNRVPRRDDEASPAEDRYSIFLAKQSNRDNSPKEQHDALISDSISHVVPSDGKGKRSIDRKVPSNFITEIEEIEEELTDCLCWRLCHIIAPFKYRSSIKERASAPRTKTSDSLLQKRKK